MADVIDLISYYVNLLIIQYSDLPNAADTIALIIKSILVDGIVEDIQNAYGVDDAVGIQLDVVGKYQNVDRFYDSTVFANYFALVPQDQHASLPTSPPAFGFGTQATFTNYNYNGTLIYNDIITLLNALSDDDFRIIVKLAILVNTSNFSMQSIDQLLYSLFGAAVRRESSRNMSIQYFLSSPISAALQAAVVKDLLPLPMGMAGAVITPTNSKMFAFTDYTGYQSPFGYGLSAYSNYATLPGEFLTYSQISEL